MQSWFYDESCLTVPFKSFTMASRLKRYLIGKLIELQHWINFVITNVKTKQWWRPGIWRSRELIQRNPHCFQLSLLLHLQVSFSKFDPKSVLWQDYGWWKNLCSQQIAKSRKRVRAALTMSSVIMILMIILWHKNNMITLIVHDMDSMWFYDNWQMLL